MLWSRIRLYLLNKVNSGLIDGLVFVDPNFCYTVNLEDGGVFDDVSDGSEKGFEFFKVYTFFVLFVGQKINGFLKELAIVLVNFL